MINQLQTVVSLVRTAVKSRLCTLLMGLSGRRNHRDNSDACLRGALTATTVYEWHIGNTANVRKEFRQV
jgi:hypothetical protein